MEGDMLEDEAPVVDEGVADGEETFPAMYEPPDSQDENLSGVDEVPPSDPEATGLVDTRPLEEQLTDAKQRITQLTAELHSARVEAKLHKHEADTYKRRLKEVLWEYLPKQRKVVEIPAVDNKCWLDESKLQLRDIAITHFIGAGHFGSVHAGYIRETNESVAIKIINKDVVMTLADMIGVEQEIRALKCLSQHPNIVRLVEVVNAPAHVILVTPYVARGNLYQFMVEFDHIPDSEIRRLLNAITSAINYIHTRNFCHRDLKPENILLDDQRNPVIIDFGLSCKINPGGLLRSFCGTDGFIAPEMRSGKPFNPKACDMFSLGGVLLELVLGRDSIVLLREIDPSNAAERLARTFAKVAETGRSNECQSLVHELLTDDVKRRLTAAKALAHPYMTGEGFYETNTPKSVGSTASASTAGGGGGGRGRAAARGASQGPLPSFASPNASSQQQQQQAVAATPSAAPTSSVGKDSGNLYRPRSTNNMTTTPHSGTTTRVTPSYQPQSQQQQQQLPSAPPYGATRLDPSSSDAAPSAPGAHPPTTDARNLLASPRRMSNVSAASAASSVMPGISSTTGGGRAMGAMLNESELMGALMSIGMATKPTAPTTTTGGSSGIFKSNFNVNFEPQPPPDPLSLGSVAAALKRHGSDGVSLPPIAAADSSNNNNNR